MRSSPSVDTLIVASASFSSGEPIPDRYSAYHENVAPALAWSSGPEETRSFAVICDDPDAPREEPFVHWLMANIPPDVDAIPEGLDKTETPSELMGGIQGTGTKHELGYFGPRPPAEHGVHHYHFRVYALAHTLNLHPGFSREALDEAMEGLILAQGEIVGTYERKE